MTSSDDGTGRTDALVLPASLRETLHRRATSGAPEEVCGVLIGERSDSSRNDSDRDGFDRNDLDRNDPDVVHEATPVPNVADAPETRYELDPAETLRVLEDTRADGDDVVGFYHSHPRGPVEPSPTDRRRATWTGYVYCIVSVDDLAAYRWTGADFRRLRVETT